MGQLLETLKSNAKFGSLFANNGTTASYKTGIAVLDYYLGYMLTVYNPDGTVAEEYPSLGLQGGCYIMDIGKSSTAKTSLMLFIAGMIVRPFKNSFILHIDLEQAMNPTRAKNMLRFSIDQMRNQYVLRQESCTMDDIKLMLMNVYKEKTEGGEKYMYHTGKKDEYGNEIVTYEPTVVLIDSIPSLSIALSENDKKDWAKLEEISSQTERMRVTAEIGRLYTELLPYLRAANIIVISINHIRVNPQMGIVKSPSELLYLNQDETINLGVV